MDGRVQLFMQFALESVARGSGVHVRAAVAAGPFLWRCAQSASAAAAAVIGIYRTSANFVPSRRS